jgi:hypothetical protein
LLVIWLVAATLLDQESPGWLQKAAFGSSPELALSVARRGAIAGARAPAVFFGAGITNEVASPLATTSSRHSRKIHLSAIGTEDTSTRDQLLES